MSWKKRKLVDRILIVATPVTALILIGFWLSLKRSNRDYYLPANYEGWVSVKYRVPDAPQLEEVDGAFQLFVSDSGTLVTSSKLEDGWGRDRFFWKTDTGYQQIPNQVRIEDEYRVHLHGRKFGFYSHESILPDLASGTDTVMWDGAKINKISNQQVDYTPGKLSLEYFYISKEAQKFTFIPPPLENDESLSSTEDRMINTRP